VGTGLEQSPDGVGQHLAAGVVDVGLEQDDRLARCPPVLAGTVGGLGAGDGPPDDDLDHIGPAVHLPGARAEPGGGDAHRGERSPGHDRGGQQGRTGRGGQLDRDVDPVGGRAPQQGDDRRGWIGQQPVGGTDHAGAGRHWAGVNGVDAQNLEGGGGADHVDDGIEPSHLVEVDLLGGPSVQLSLDVGQRPERPQGAAGDPLGEPGLLDHPGDVRCGAHDRRLDHVHVRLGGGDAAPEHGLGLEPPAVGR
jgi:hypothetical protein